LISDTANSYKGVAPICFATSPDPQEATGSWITDRVALLEGDESWRDLEARQCVKSQLDAAFFHLYGIERDEVDYIMETFAIVKRKDIAAHGEYRTKQMILEIYDAMAEAMRTGVPYESN